MMMQQAASTQPEGVVLSSVRASASDGEPVFSLREPVGWMAEAAGPKNADENNSRLGQPIGKQGVLETTDSFQKMSVEACIKK